MKAWDIIIIGCGATGSHYISMLAQFAINNSFIKSITLIDGDVIEYKNLRNQKYTKKDIGKCKSEVLATRYSRLGINISFVDKFVECEEDITSLFPYTTGASYYRGYDKDNVIIVSCVDNNKARCVINDVFVKDKHLDNFAYIDTGNDNNSKKGQTVLGYKTRGKVCKEPIGSFFPEIYEKEVVEEVSCEAVNRETPQHFVTNVLSATTAFMLTSSVLEDDIEDKGVYMFNADAISIKPF